ncbi:MAG: sigma-70 family RNA polymerase sigma factor [Planctomycetes bacterium]|nr:sigma-70 family RNA polymerase sigma factor [Planctomycetota bacterium]
MTSPLGDLIERALAGDSHAQEGLYDQFAAKVHRLAVRMVGASDAADVTQQTFVKMFRGLPAFQGNASFSTWLYRIAVNECLQHRRRERRPVHELPAEFPDRSVEPSRRVEQADLLQHALGNLDEKLRAIFLLREVEGLSYEEIAEVLEIPTGTVGSQLNRARGEMRDFLTKAMSE